MDSDRLASRVAANVRALRRQRKLTQHALAEALEARGVTSLSRSALANFETGRRDDVTVDELAALADVFDVDPWSLTFLHVVCLHCGGQPPAGYICRVCGADL